MCDANQNLKARRFLSGPLRKQKFTSTSWKGYELQFVIGRFRSVSCLSVFQGLLLVRVGVNLAFTFFSLLTEKWQVEKLFRKSLQINPRRRKTDMPSWQCSDCNLPGRHKKGRGRGRKTRKVKRERDPLSPIPLPLSLSPNHLPHLTPATQGSLIHNCKANCGARGEWLASHKCLS